MVKVVDTPAVANLEETAGPESVLMELHASSISNASTDDGATASSETRTNKGQATSMTSIDHRREQALCSRTLLMMIEMRDSARWGCTVCGAKAEGSKVFGLLC
jgi:hypothetical protein